MPIATRIAASAVNVRATAALTGATLPPLAAGVGLRDGRLDVRVDGSTVEVQGTTALTNLPALTTPVTLALTVAPDPGDGARRARVTARGGRDRTAGQVTARCARRSRSTRVSSRAGARASRCRDRDARRRPVALRAAISRGRSAADPMAGTRRRSPARASTSRACSPAGRPARARRRRSRHATG